MIMYARYIILTCIFFLLIVLIGCGRSRSGAVQEAPTQQPISPNEIKKKITPAHEIWWEYQKLKSGTNVTLSNDATQTKTAFILPIVQPAIPILHNTEPERYIGQSKSNAIVDYMMEVKEDTDEKLILERVRQFISEGLDVNAKPASGYTPLHLAAMWNKVEVVKCLVANGANVNAKTQTLNETPLDIARRRRSTEAVMYLSGIR